MQSDCVKRNGVSKQNHFSTEMACPYCYAYVYDQLCRPAPHRRTFSFEGLINLKRGMRNPHAYVNMFMRASADPKECSHIALAFVESGGVMRPGRMKINPLCVARMWIDEKMKEIGDVDQIHYLHTVGFEPEPPPPKLSIRIPKRRNSIT